MKASMSSHYLLNVSDLYCILCSYFILKNVAVHAAVSVKIKDETWNSGFDKTHDALDDDIDINYWSDVEKTALANDICIHQDNINSNGRDAVESKGNDAVESEKCFQDKDDDSAFVEDGDSAIVNDDDSAFVRDDSKLPKPSSSWSQPPTMIKVEE